MSRATGAFGGGARASSGGGFGRSLSGLSGTSGASGGKSRFATPEDEARVKMVFDALDEDKSGTLERSEILSAISALGIPLQDSSAIEELCGAGAQADHTHLTYEKFAKLALASDVEDLHLDECVKLFRTLDRETAADSAKEGGLKQYDAETKARKARLGKKKAVEYAAKGALSWRDLKHLAHDIGEDIDDELLKEMCRVLDRDGDGMIGPDDFYGAITSATQIQHSHPEGSRAGYNALVKQASSAAKPGGSGPGLRDLFGAAPGKSIGGSIAGRSGSAAY